MGGIFALGLWLLGRLSIHASDWFGQHCGGHEDFCAIKAGAAAAAK
jgi:hypothetical protein